MNTHTTHNPLLPVAFQGDTLLLIEHQGQPYVVARRICEAIGLHWSTQAERLQEGRFNCAVIRTVGLDGKQREMHCLPLRKLPGWLMTISPAKVKLEIRPKLLAYQAECDDALWDYWSTGQATNPRAAADGYMPRHAASLVKLVNYAGEDTLRGDYAREAIKRFNITPPPRTSIALKTYQFLCDWQKHGLTNYSGKGDKVYLRWPEAREKASAKGLTLPPVPPP